MAKQSLLFWTFMLPIIGLFGCSRDTVRVSGDVVRIRGNQMPSPDAPPPVYPGYVTTLYFFEPFKSDRAVATAEAGVYREIHSPLKARVSTDEMGRFSLRLPTGRYSVLIGRDSLFYTNQSDGEGYLNPVEVKTGAPNRLRLQADWDAVY